MNIFLICPVRSATPEQLVRIQKYVSDLESSGITVYYPARDTDQVDSIGYRICTDNKNAIINADEVHIFWYKNSQGSLFDIGMTFALNKKMVIANIEEVEQTETKSFSNMIREWAINHQIRRTN
jgi:hypothetical protein